VLGMRALVLAGFFAAAPFVALAAAPTVEPAPALSSTAAPAASDPRTAMHAARDRARDAAFGALSADHARAARVVIADADAGTIDRETAARRIDALLTKDESERVLQADAGFRSAMASAFAGGYGGPGGLPGAPPVSARAIGRSHGPGFRSGDGLATPSNLMPDAGRALLMLGSNARRSMRDQRGAPPSEPSPAP